MKKFIFASLLLSVVILTGCHNQKTASIQVADSSGNVEAKVGELFMIQLEANHTTGYSWRLAEYKPVIIEKVSSNYVPTKTQGRIVGSGGTEEWIFKAVSKGKVIIIFEYARPWEKDVPPIKRAVYQVVVK